MQSGDQVGWCAGKQLRMCVGVRAGWQVCMQAVVHVCGGACRLASVQAGSCACVCGCVKVCKCAGRQWCLCVGVRVLASVHAEIGASCAPGLLWLPWVPGLLGC